MNGIQEALINASDNAVRVDLIGGNVTASIPSGTITVSQLPAASGLMDGTANPTTSLIGGLPHVWNGGGASGTWNRCLDITAANGLNFLGAGLPAVGLTVFDTVNAQYRRLNSAASAVAGGLDGTRVIGVGNLVFGANNFWNQKGLTDGTAVVSGGVVVSNTPNVTTLGNAARIKATPTMSGATYSAGQLIGTKLVLSGATRIAGLGTIESLVLSDKAKAAGAVIVVFFEANPSSTTFTDHVTLNVNNTDLVNIVGHVSIATTDYFSFSANAVATKANLGLEFNSTDTNLYAAIVANGTNAYTSVSDLQLTVTILQVS